MAKVRVKTKTELLGEAIASIQNTAEAIEFLQEFCSRKELKSMKHRWTILHALALNERLPPGKRQTNKRISQDLGVGEGTVGKVKAEIYEANSTARRVVDSQIDKRSKIRENPGK